MPRWGFVDSKLQKQVGNLNWVLKSIYEAFFGVNSNFEEDNISPEEAFVLEDIVVEKKVIIMEECRIMPNKIGNDLYTNTFCITMAICMFCFVMTLFFWICNKKEFPNFPWKPLGTFFELLK